MKQPVPERIANAPELFPWLHGEYEAFFELSTCRVDGVIPWTAIHHYASVHGFADSLRDFERFTWLVRAMDKVYVEKKAEKRLQDKAQQKQENKQGRR